MEVLQNGFAKFATITKPIEVPLTNGNGITNHLNLITETEDLSNMDPSRAFVNKVKRLIVKVLLMISSIFLFSLSL